MSRLTSFAFRRPSVAYRYTQLQKARKPRQGRPLDVVNLGQRTHRPKPAQPTASTSASATLTLSTAIYKVFATAPYASQRFHALRSRSNVALRQLSCSPGQCSGHRDLRADRTCREHLGLARRGLEGFRGSVAFLNDHFLSCGFPLLSSSLRTHVQF